MLLYFMYKGRARVKCCSWSMCAVSGEVCYGWPYVQNITGWVLRDKTSTEDKMGGVVLPVRRGSSALFCFCLLFGVIQGRWSLPGTQLLKETSVSGKSKVLPERVNWKGSEMATEKRLSLCFWYKGPGQKGPHSLRAGSSAEYAGECSSLSSAASTLWPTAALSLYWLAEYVP